MGLLIPGLPDEISLECLIRIPYDHLSTASFVCKRWKSEIQSQLFRHQRKANGFTQPIIVLTQAQPQQYLRSVKFIATPVYQLTVFEPETGAWNRLQAIPGHTDGLPMFCQCVGVGQCLVVIGGWNPTNWAVSKSVHVYDFVTATWRRGTDMPAPSRSFFACATDKVGMVYVAGGHDEEKNALRSALAYDVAKDEWLPLADMARERDECKGLFHGGKFHVIGGYCSAVQGRFERSAESFDCDTWKWDPVQEDALDTGVCPRTCVADDVGIMYNFLGDDVKVLDGNMWKWVIGMPTDVQAATTVVTWQAKTLVIGGSNHKEPNNCYVFEGGKWKKVERPQEFKGHVQNGCSLDI